MQNKPGETEKDFSIAFIIILVVLFLYGQLKKPRLTPLQQKISDALLHFDSIHVNPSDEQIATRIGPISRGEEYTRQTINRERSKLRKSEPWGEMFNPVQQKIIEALFYLKDKGIDDPSDAQIAERVGTNRRGQDYTRETINRERSKLRKMGFDV